VTAQLAPPPALAKRYTSAEVSLVDAAILSGGRDLARLRWAVGAEDFGDPNLGRVWSALVDLFDAGRHVDPIQLEARLRERGELELVGGIDRILQRSDGRGLIGEAPAYAEIVRGGGARRRYLEALTQAAKRCRLDDGLDGADEWGSFATETARDLADLARSGRAVTGGLDQLKVFETTIAGIRRRVDTQTFGSIGWRSVDEQACPDAGNLVLVAARPSMGKSAFMMSLTRELMMERDPNASGWSWRKRARPIPVFLASVEMTNESLNERVWSDLCTIDGRWFKRPTRDFLQRNEERMGRALKEWVGCPIRWAEDASQLERVEAQARAWRREFPAEIGVVFVDYLQLITTREREANANYQFGAISKRLKALAGELGVIVVLLSQLNRDLEKRESKWPTLADLRDSGELEQNADVVLFVHRPVRYGKLDETALATRIEAIRNTERKTDEERRQFEADQLLLREAWILIAKARNGQVGRVQCQYHRQFTRFEAPRSSHA
jgi:replicative DNA helicase